MPKSVFHCSTTLVLALSFFLISTAVRAAEKYQPVRLSALSNLSFPADARLNFGQEGTIEFWFSATANNEQPQCLISHGKDEKLQFSVLIGPKRKAIFLKTPTITYSVPFDFSDGEFHHVGFMMSGGLTTVLIDGVKPGMPGDDPDVVLELPDIPLRFGKGSVGGEQLSIGCGEPEPFEGWIYTLRFWEKALSSFELDAVSKFYGLPVPGQFDNIEELNRDSLIAYTTFSNEKRSLNYREAAIHAATTKTGLSSQPEVTLLRRSLVGAPQLNGKLNRIFWQNSSSGIRDIRFEYLGANDVPILRPARENWTTDKQKELERIAFKALPDAGSFEPARQQALTQAYRLQGLYNPNTDVGENALKVTGWNIFQLREGEEVWSIAGMHDTQEVSALRFFTNVRTFNSPLMGHTKGSSEIFHLKRPAFSKFEGLAIERKRDDAVRSISLLFSKGEVPEEHRAALTLSKGVWIERDGCQPRLNDELAYLKNHRHSVNDTTLLHGLYTTPTVVKYHFDPVFNTLKQWTDRQLAFGDREEDSGHCGAAQVGSPVIEQERLAKFVSDRPNTFKGIKRGRAHSLVHLVDDGREINTENGGVDLPGPFIRAQQPKNSTRDKIAWGGTFALPHRPANIGANFVGYDITLLDPHNFLRSHGLKSRVFEYPSDRSNDYQTTDNNKIIPNGMIYKHVAASAENARTRMFGGSADYSKEFSYSLGMNLGFGLEGIGAAFSANYSHSKRVESRVDRELIMSVTRTNVAKYSIIADRSLIKLSKEFRRDVLAMRDRELLGLKTPMASFIAKYGTHYPYAVTYGGMAFLETTYSKELVDHMVETSESLQESASVSFAEQSKSNGCGCDSEGGGGLNGQLGVDTSLDSKHRLATEVRRSDESRVFGTYGGSVSRGEGWSLSAGEEVPLLFDLRPISDLLSPIFFDDPIVHETIRLRVKNRVRNYLIEVATNFRRPAPTWYRSAKPGYVTKQPTVFSDKHRVKHNAKHEDDK